MSPVADLTLDDMRIGENLEGVRKRHLDTVRFDSTCDIEEWIWMVRTRRFRDYDA